jgi:hypothetical protein
VEKILFSKLPIASECAEERKESPVDRHIGMVLPEVTGTNSDDGAFGIRRPWLFVGLLVATAVVLVIFLPGWTSKISDATTEMEAVSRIPYPPPAPL